MYVLPAKYQASSDSTFNNTQKIHSLFILALKLWTVSAQ